MKSGEAAETQQDLEKCEAFLSCDCARGTHRTVSAAASRRHVDASLDLFARKSAHVAGEI